jgi:serine/threonine protein phosphatase 1
MIYVISDIHGCYDEFLALLQKIQLTEEDELFLLGDLLDRGPEPIKLIQDIMLRTNVYTIMGNHEYMAYRVLKKMNVEITAQNAEAHLTEEDITAYLHWTQDGGAVTAKQFSRLTDWEKEDILEYLADSSFYEELCVNEQRYILVHGGLSNFSKERALHEYDFAELLFQSPDYSRTYFEEKNVFLVTGHTPTLGIPGHEKPEIFQGNGHIAIDCGCVFGGRLAAICLDTGEMYYVDSHQKEAEMALSH